MESFKLDQVNVQWSRAGRPQKITGEIVLPKASSIEKASIDFLRSNASELRLNIDPATLKLVHETETLTRKVLRYQQVIDNIPIFESYVIVQTDRNQKIKQLDFGHVNNLRIVGDTNSPHLKAAQADEIALKSLPKATLRNPKPEPSLIYYPTPNGLVLSWLVLVLTQNPMHDWQIIINAHTGEILRKEDIIKSMPDGSGLVFDPNPVVTANNNALRQPTATTAGGCAYNGSPLADIDAQRVTRTLKDLTLSGGVHTLDGPFARVINISSPTSTIPTEANANDFNYSSSDERLGAVNCYYHIDTIQRYIQGLGITTANNRRTDCDPAVSGFSAYYSPVDKSLHMGTSRPCHPDKSQEGDAIIHEYGHAIQDNQVPGWGGTNPVTMRQEAGAMGEGFGDILACVFFANAGNQFQRESFEDWAYVENGASALRRVDGTKIYPTNWNFEVHDDGEIWSAALWNIYRTIGGDSLVPSERLAARDALLKSVINSHPTLATNASMPDGAEAVMTSNAELDDYRGKHLVQMLNSFHDRGILKCDAGVDLFMHDASTDTGTEPFGGVFWESPDLWIRHSDDGGTTHQEPEFGQDNYFYARVTNRGGVNARAFVVSFNVKPWAGVQFVTPGDFTPYISAVPGFNLAPGASTVVKAKWPASMILPTGTHACLLAQVYIPTETIPSGSHVWDKNNLAQKNMTILDVIPGDVVYADFQLGNLHQRIPELYRLEVVRPPRWDNIKVSLVSRNNFETAKLFKSRLSWTPREIGKLEEEMPTIKFREHTSLEVVGGKPSAVPFLFNVSPGSSIQYKNGGGEAPSVEFENDARLLESPRMSEIEMNDGRLVGLPVLIEPGMQLKCALKFEVPKDAPIGKSLLFRVIQRNQQGRIIGGISVQANIVAKKK